MTDPELQRIFASEQFTSLVRLRRRLAWTLTWAVLGAFGVFVAAALYAPDFMHLRLSGIELPLGTLLAGATVLLCIGGGWVYLIVANRWLEPLGDHLRRETSS
jgi:uncharacterized membrane protein (DUF485 family)